MRFKMAGKFKTTTNYLHYKPAYNVPAKRGVADGYNP